MRKKRTRVDTSKMTAKELKKYKKTLATVRQYNRARAEWHKAIKSGELDASISLSDYRDMKSGHKSAKAQDIINDISHAHEEALADNILLDKLQKMMDTIKGNRKRNSELVQLLEKKFSI